MAAKPVSAGGSGPKRRTLYLLGAGRGRRRPEGQSDVRRDPVVRPADPWTLGPEFGKVDGPERFLIGGLEHSGDRAVGFHQVDEPVNARGVGPEVRAQERVDAPV